MGEMCMDRLYLLEFVVYEAKYLQTYTVDSGPTRVVFTTDSFPVLEVRDEASSDCDKTVFNRGKSCLFGLSNGAERSVSDKVQIVISRKSSGSSYFNVGTAYLKLSQEFLSVLTKRESCTKDLKVSLDLLNGLMEVVGDISIHLRMSYLGQNIVMQMPSDGMADRKTLSLQHYNDCRNSFPSPTVTASQPTQSNSHTGQIYNPKNMMNYHLPGIPYTILPATVNYSQTYYMPPNCQIPSYGFSRPTPNLNNNDWNNSVATNYHNQPDWFKSNNIPNIPRTTPPNKFPLLIPQAASLSCFDPRKQFASEPRELIFRDTLAAQTSENILFKRSMKMKESNRQYSVRQTQNSKCGWYSPATGLKRNVHIK